MKKTLSLSISMFLILASSLNVFSVNVEKIFEDLSQLTNTLSNEQTGIISSINHLQKNYTILKGLKQCSRLSKEKRATSAFSVKNPDGTSTKFACNNIKGVIQTLIPIFTLLQNNIIGNEQNPGIIYIILSILDNSGVPNIKEVQGVVKNLHKIMLMTTKLLNASEDKLKISDK